jgi:hypothetical protein
MTARERGVVKELLVPDQREDFLWGNTPYGIKIIFHGMLARVSEKRVYDQSEAMCTEVKLLVWDFYGSIWDKYKELLVLENVDFKSRLWATNRLTVKDLGRRVRPG